MTWTYDPVLVLPKDVCRLEVGDTLELDPLFADEEILYALSVASNNTTRAAVYLAEKAAIKFARMVTMSTPDLRVELGERAKQYRVLAQDLREQLLRRSTPMPYAGGISVTDKALRAADTDRVAPAVQRGLYDTAEGA